MSEETRELSDWIVKWRGRRQGEVRLQTGGDINAREGGRGHTRAHETTERKDLSPIGGRSMGIIRSLNCQRDECLGSQRVPKDIDQHGRPKLLFEFRRR